MIDLVSVTQALLVAEHLSFSRAAQVLGVRQSAVSRRVRALEDKLGVSLFERDLTGVRLTEAGRRFLERTRPALSEIDHAMKAAASAGRGAEGVIRIGILASVSGGFLRNLLGSYREHHPAIAMEIVEGSASEHLARITERHLDVAFVTGTPVATHCDSVVLWEARVFAALPEHHVLADGDAIHWESLKDEDFIVSRDAPGPEIHDYIVRRTTAFGRSPSIERHGVGGETLMHLVALGLRNQHRQRSGDRDAVSRGRFPPAGDRGRHAALQRGLAARQRQSSAAAFSQPCSLVGVGPAGAGRAEVGFLTLRSLANARSPAMKRASIGATSLAGSIDGLSGFATQGIGVGDEVAVYRRRQLDRQLDRLVVGNRAEFQLRHRSPPQP